MAAASDTESSEADLGAIVAGLLIAIVGAWLAWRIFNHYDPSIFTPKAEYSVFAAAFVLAAAIERALEPFTRFIPPDSGDAKKKVEQAVADAKNAAASRADDVEAKAKAAANAQARLTRFRASRAVILWGLASAVAMVLCARFGVLLLNSIASVPNGGTPPWRVLDLVMTGLIIGAGTKPLHELTGRLTASKEKATDPTETNG